MHVLVLGPKVPPLKTIDWSQVPLLPMAQADAIEVLPAAVPVPDPNSLILKEPRIGTALHKPEELLDDPAPENPLCGQQGECVPEVVAHGAAKEGVGPSAGPVGAVDSTLDDPVHEVEVLRRKGLKYSRESKEGRESE